MSKIKMNKSEFIATVIGEGSQELWQEAVGNEKLYNQLMKEDSDEITDIIAKNLNNRDLNNLNTLASRYSLDIEIL